jgi:transcriptional antiterminator NusG
MKKWVILFVQTGAEERLTRLLKKKLNADEYLPFLPVKETAYRNKGVIRKEQKLLFPGYIFIQTEIEDGLIADKLKLALMNTIGQKYIYSILHYGDNKKDVVLRDKERKYLECLFNSNFCVMGSVGFIEGDMIRVTSGALIGMESRIKKINRHKREAVVEFEMLGSLRKITLMLEVIEKI